ncbi:hypothetical protein Hypma_008430 [Hypsizygus marmoreus]|uniref:Uncharacterized protein n=1 Tax=Hypsizygus marmoreus TaxID=39966 RepID=A0A369JYF1_HYPMA|nr:hypothetical protein Hypma_008430 [Hypsizygus marmoreus]
MANLSRLLALFLESVAYGTIALALHDGHLKSRRDIHITMTVAAFAIFTIATFDLGITVDQSIRLYVDRDPRADPTLGNTTNWWGIVQFCNFVVITFIGDLILSYTPHAHKTPACGIAAAILASSTFHLSDLGNVTPLVTSMLSLTLASNFTSSSLIVVRIWAVYKESARYRTLNEQDPLTKAIRVTIEAGLLYTAFLVILLSTYASGCMAQIPIWRLGITFNLIIRRTARKREDALAVFSMPPPPVAINMEVSVAQEPAENPPSSPSAAERGEKYRRW